MQVVIGRIGKAHGIRGEVTVEVRTDDPDGRFAPEAVLTTDRPERPTLVIEKSRPHHGRMLVLFEGVPDRNAAELLRGTLLSVDAGADPDLDDPDEFYDHQLVGLTVVTVDGEVLGEVSDVVHLPASVLLSVARPEARELLVPFVASIVPEVDLPGGRVVVDLPPGLLDLAEG
ncbi:MAG: rRNA processing protein RimM [Frankiales bacterium]|nr:rRNA processing protein RimM [Frankiales bacterium]